MTKYPFVGGHEVVGEIIAMGENTKGLEIGDTVTISMIDLPAGATPTIDRDFVIANIQAPSGLASQAEEEEEAAADEVPTTDEDEAEAEGGEE